MAGRRVGTPGFHQGALFDAPLQPTTPFRRRSRRRRPDHARSGGSQQAAPSTMVLQFHHAFDLPVASHPTADIPANLLRLRGELLTEELDELALAIETRDIIGIADALADAVYVLYGTAWTFGIDLDRVLAEIHRANMSKLDRDGRPILRADGKVLKGPRYEPPNLAVALGLAEAANQSSCR